MEALEQIREWISENESLFSGLAAIVALIAIVPAALRPILRRRRDNADERNASPGGRTPDVRVPASAAASSKPRLAVFPVKTGTSESHLAIAAEIITEELTAMLARSRGCEVISDRSSAAFADRGGTAVEALDQLDVQYVVEGQIRSLGSELRVSAQLVDTQQDSVLWTEYFEAANDDPATVARPLAERVASHLGIELTRAEVGRSRRASRSPAARDLVLRSQGILFDEGHSRSSYTQAIELLERAIEIDPDDAEAYSLFALLVALGKIFNFVDQLDSTREKALAACRRAIEIDDRSSDILGYVGCAYCDLRHYETGIPLLERAIERNPSNAQAKAALGTALIGHQRFAEGVSALENALRISPAFKGIAPWATVLAGGYLRLGKTDEASASIDRALSSDTTFFPAHLTAAVIAVAKGDRASAARHVEEAQRMHPDMDQNTVIEVMGRTSVGILSEWLDLGAVDL